MTYCKIEAGTTITTHSYESLVVVYEQYKSCRELIRRMHSGNPIISFAVALC